MKYFKAWLLSRLMRKVECRTKVVGPSWDGTHMIRQPDPTFGQRLKMRAIQWAIGD